MKKQKSLRERAKNYIRKTKDVRSWATRDFEREVNAYLAGYRAAKREHFLLGYAAGKRDYSR